MKKRRKQSPYPATLILLAGGPSRRMRRDKALMPAPNEPMIQKILGRVEGLFDEVIVSVAKGRRYDFLPYRQVEDEAEGQGPLAGILAGLRAARHETALVLACDIPEPDVSFLLRLPDEAEGFDAVVPRTPRGLEPLLAVYKKSVISHIEKLLEEGDYQVLALFEICRTKYEDIEDAAWLKNLNTPEDYKNYLRSLGRQ